MILKISGVIFALQFLAGVAASRFLDSCDVKVEPIGCYKDQYNDRALAKEILNARQHDRDIYAGYYIDWFNWEEYLSKFICQCAKLAFAKGYRVIGIQFYGECWAALNGHLKYDKHGESKTCVHGEKKYWGPCKANDVACTGEALTNFVYRIAPTVCDTYYEPVGCYKDNGNVPRPVPNYIMNERDYSASNWNGHLIDWGNWDEYSPQMICRCANKAKSLGRTTFSIQFYGECWSGEESKIKYAKDGKSDKKCLAGKFLACPYNSYHCVGKDHGNRVYKIKEIPAPAKPWKTPETGMPLILSQDEAFETNESQPRVSKQDEAMEASNYRNERRQVN